MLGQFLIGRKLIVYLTCNITDECDKIKNNVTRILNGEL